MGPWGPLWLGGPWCPGAHCGLGLGLVASVSMLTWKQTDSFAGRELQRPEKLQDLDSSSHGATTILTLHIEFPAPRLSPSGHLWKCHSATPSMCHQNNKEQEEHWEEEHFLSASNSFEEQVSLVLTSACGHMQTRLINPAFSNQFR